MKSIPQVLRSFSLHAPSRTIGLVFAINSFLVGQWIIKIPEVKDNLGMTEGELGLVLLGMPIGSLAIMPFIGWFIHHWGAGKTTFFTALFYCVTILVPVFMPTFWWLAISLIAAGAAMGSMDVAMNAGAAAVEKNYKNNIMSTCHGLFSLGGGLGAGFGSVLAGFGLPSFIHLPALGFLAVVSILLLSRALFRIKETEYSGSSFALPSKPVIGLALIGFCILIGEGAMADWTAVYLKDYLAAGTLVAGLGFTGFSVGMTIGRFSGDYVIPLWGSRKIVQGGALLAAVGLSVGLVMDVPLMAILGFTLVGLGFSCVVPVLFSAAARVPGVAPGTSIAAVTGLSYTGFMLGPPLIGFIADEFDLGVGLSLVVVLSLFSIFISRFIRF